MFNFKLLLCVLKTASELVNTSAGVNKLLFAGEERMALGADINTDISALCGTGCKCFSASADNVYLVVIRMNSFFHDLIKVHSLKNDSRDFARLTVFGNVRPPFDTSYQSLILYHTYSQISSTSKKINKLIFKFRIGLIYASKRFRRIIL